FAFLFRLLHYASHLVAAGVISEFGLSERVCAPLILWDVVHAAEYRLSPVVAGCFDVTREERDVHVVLHAMQRLGVVELAADLHEEVVSAVAQVEVCLPHFNDVRYPIHELARPFFAEPIVDVPRCEALALSVWSQTLTVKFGA